MNNPYKKKLICEFILLFTLGLCADGLRAQEATPRPTSTPVVSSNEQSPNSLPTEATSNITSEEKPIFASTMERDNALLALALPNEAQWLVTPREKIIVLFKAGETRKIQGSFLILHAPELPQLWPAPLEILRRNLPIYGWDTLAVPLPSLNATKTSGHYKSVDTSSSSNVQSTSIDSSTASSVMTSSDNSSSATQASLALSQESTSLPRTQSINERINAAITLLSKIGQPNLVVLVDNSSAPDSLVELSKNAIQALILVNLQSQEPLTQMQLAAMFSDVDLPVLDVFFRPDDKYQIEVRRLHHAEAMRKNLRNYQQLILPPEHFIAVNNKQSFWLEKVRGFINKKSEKSAEKK